MSLQDEIILLIHRRSVHTKSDIIRAVDTVGIDKAILAIDYSAKHAISLDFVITQMTKVRS